MFNSLPFSNIINSSPFFPADNISSLNYLMDSLPSPYFSNEITNFDYLIANHEDLILNQSNDFNNSILTDDSSIVEVDKKVNSSKGDEVNRILEDGEMTHIISSITNKKKKRSSNKDRHSKIRTAHGLRDRRMRLSLQVARPFFQLQDILGFDKASKTVEWLLVQSSTAIEKLLQSNHESPSGVANYAMSSTTSDDCEVQSTVIDQWKESSTVKKRSLTCVGKEEPRQKRKITTKEERKKARDWARKRTLDKLQRRRVVNGADDTNCLENQIPLSFSSYQQNYQVFQNVSSCTISRLPNMFGGPQ